MSAKIRLIFIRQTIKEWSAGVWSKEEAKREIEPKLEGRPVEAWARELESDGEHADAKRLREIFA